MKRIFYYTTTALVLSCGISQAQTCVPTPDCQTLGYTSGSYCDGGLKCPFGNYWNCDAVNCELSGKVTELTEKIIALETLITSSSEDNKNKTYDCLIGDIFYSDWTCSTELDANKTPIAVVVYMDGAGHGQALALKSAGSYVWQGKNVSYNDIEILPNYGKLEATKDFLSCSNTKKLMNLGNSNDFPAAWSTYYYITQGTENGNWCLPAAGILNSYKKNKDIINTGFTKAKGTKFTSGTHIWASTEYGGNSYDFDIDTGLDWAYKDNSYEVRPVLEF